LGWIFETKLESFAGCAKGSKYKGHKAKDKEGHASIRKYFRVLSRKSAKGVRRFRVNLENSFHNYIEKIKLFKGSV